MYLAWLRLAGTPAIGPVLGHRLLEVFGDAEVVFRADRVKLRAVRGFGLSRVDSLFDAASLDQAKTELLRARDQGVRLIHCLEPDYPPLLRQLPAHPLVLWNSSL